MPPQCRLWALRVIALLDLSFLSLAHGLSWIISSIWSSEICREHVTLSNSVSQAEHHSQRCTRRRETLHNQASRRVAPRQRRGPQH